MKHYVCTIAITNPSEKSFLFTCLLDFPMPGSWQYCYVFSSTCRVRHICCNTINTTISLRTLKNTCVNKGSLLLHVYPDFSAGHTIYDTKTKYLLIHVTVKHWGKRRKLHACGNIIYVNTSVVMNIREHLCM